VYNEPSYAKNVFRVTVELPDGKIKRFRTDEFNEDITIARFEKIYGKDKIVITREQVASKF
jgi:hypothetical protein